MITVNNIAEWVEAKPLILVSFDETLSTSLRNSRRGLNHLTFAKGHSIFHNFKPPTLCLLELQEGCTTECYIGCAISKQSITNFETRITIKILREINPQSFRGIGSQIVLERHNKAFAQKLTLGDFPLVLPPKLSSYLIRMLAGDPHNERAITTVAAHIPGLDWTLHINRWTQRDAIHSAMKVFGLSKNEVSGDVALLNGSSSEIALLGEYLYEDNVIRHDATQIPGFELIASDITGRATFRRNNEQLIVYTANRLPLEEMLGVDLIYINETRGNIVMVQYKMLESEKNENRGTDWMYRPDRHLDDQVERMKIPDIQESKKDYRLNANPFYFKFIKRRGHIGSKHTSFFISLEHLKQILSAPSSRGPRGGVRLGYEALDGTYLRESDIIGLIRSGYIGTHQIVSSHLAAIISEVSRGERALVLAWQRRLTETTTDSNDEQVSFSPIDSLG